MILAGLAAGIAVGTKTTHVLLIPIGLAYLAVTHRSRGIGDVLRTMGLLTISGWLALNAVYQFPPIGRPLGQYEFISESLGGPPAGIDPSGTTTTGNRFAGTWIGRLPVPLPDDLVLGIDAQRRDFEHYSQPSYLLGEFRDHGWWHYYCWVLLFKTPLATMGLAAAAIVTWAVEWRRGRSLPPGVAGALTIGVAYAAVISSQSGISQHGRYLLPAYPPMLLAIAATLGWAWGGKKAAKPKRRLAVAMGTGVAALLIPVLSCVPHHLSFHNSLADIHNLVDDDQVAPPPLLHSNVDWGQDLLRLENHEGLRHRDAKIHLAVCELYNPFAITDQRWVPWPSTMRRPAAGRPAGGTASVPEGWYAITVNRLWGAPLSACDRSGTYLEIDPVPLRALQQTPPAGRVGGSIVLFTADQMRKAYQASAQRSSPAESVPVKSGGAR